LPSLVVSTLQRRGIAGRLQPFPTLRRSSCVTPQESQFRLEALIASMGTRLRPVCANWPDDEFDRMIRELAEITLKYEGRANGGMYDRRATDRLVAELRSALEENSARRERNSDDGQRLMGQVKAFFEDARMPAQEQESE
jgi:hypothetical protein